MLRVKSRLPRSRGPVVVIDRHVGERSGHAAQRRKLFAVHVAVGAEDANQPAGGDVAGRLQAGSQRVRRVGGVDEHRKILAADDALHPAGKFFDRFEAAGDRRELDAVGQAQAPRPSGSCRRGGRRRSSCARRPNRRRP